MRDKKVFSEVINSLGLYRHSTNTRNCRVRQRERSEPTNRQGWDRSRLEVPVRLELWREFLRSFVSLFVAIEAASGFWLWRVIANKGMDRCNPEKLWKKKLKFIGILLFEAKRNASKTFDFSRAKRKCNKREIYSNLSFIFRTSMQSSNWNSRFIRIKNWWCIFHLIVSEKFNWIKRGKSVKPTRGSSEHFLFFLWRCSHEPKISSNNQHLEIQYLTAYFAYLASEKKNGEAIMANALLDLWSTYNNISRAGNITAFQWHISRFWRR